MEYKLYMKMKLRQRFFWVHQTNLKGSRSPADHIEWELSLNQSIKLLETLNCFVFEYPVHKWYCSSYNIIYEFDE